jgi:hypothetical protein
MVISLILGRVCQVNSLGRKGCMDATHTYISGKASYLVKIEAMDNILGGSNSKLIDAMWKDLKKIQILINKGLEKKKGNSFYDQGYPSHGTFRKDFGSDFDKISKDLVSKVKRLK